MAIRTAHGEHRLAAIWFAASAVFLAAMLAMWWLVETTNEEGRTMRSFSPGSP